MSTLRIYSHWCDLRCGQLIFNLRPKQQDRSESGLENSFFSDLQVSLHQCFSYFKFNMRPENQKKKKKSTI